MYAQGRGVMMDLEAAAKWYRMAADNGSAMAQNNLGATYAKGRGVQQDYVQASQWFAKAAEQGDAQAQASLGYLYKEGLGVERDSKAAYMWLSLARAGHQTAIEPMLNEVRRALANAELEEASGRAQKFLAQRYQVASVQMAD
jgi:hypothetical protein